MKKYLDDATPAVAKIYLPRDGLKNLGKVGNSQHNSNEFRNSYYNASIAKHKNMKEQRAPSAGIDETTIIYKSKSPPNRKSEELASSINIGHNHERNTYKPRNNYNIKLNQGN